MKIRIFQADAFTDRVFAGNPAAVCPLDSWLPDQVLQSIATENNLSETAFLVGGSGHYQLRWFTPVSEVDLCGHATLATAFVLYARLGETAPSLRFETMSGPLEVAGEGDMLRMDFPSRPPEACEVPPELVRGLGAQPELVLASRDWMAVYASEAEVRNLAPDMVALSGLDRLGVIATAPADEPGVDFVSRFFVPGEGIPEDPVTGSAHCTLIPYWAERLGRTRMEARQVSRRGGELSCELLGDRVAIRGRAVLYMEGTLTIGL